MKRASIDTSVVRMLLTVPGSAERVVSDDAQVRRPLELPARPVGCGRRSGGRVSPWSRVLPASVNSLQRPCSPAPTHEGRAARPPARWPVPVDVVTTSWPTSSALREQLGSSDRVGGALSSFSHGSPRRRRLQQSQASLPPPARLSTWPWRIRGGKWNVSICRTCHLDDEGSADPRACHVLFLTPSVSVRDR
jgi:hypothetical protein